MKKFVATAVLAVAISAVAAAPAFADDLTSNENLGLVNANQLGVGNIGIPINISCKSVTLVGNATADDCKGEAVTVNNPQPEAPEKPAKVESVKEGSLPVTGVSTGIIAGTAALMVVGGVFAVRVARRRGAHAASAA